MYVDRMKPSMCISATICMLQNIVMPSALIAGCIIVAATPLFYVLTVVLPWGLAGAAVALNTANLFAMIAILIWTFVIVKCAAPGDSKKQSWQGFTPEAFQVLHLFLSHVCLSQCTNTCTVVFIAKGIKHT